MRFYLIGVLSLLPLLALWGQEPMSYAEKYDLDFKRLGQTQATWSLGNFISSNTFGYSTADSVRRVYGRFLWERPVEYHLWKSIRLPHRVQESLEVRAKLLFATADSVSMIVHRLAKGASDVRVDTTTWRRPLDFNEMGADVQQLNIHYPDNTTFEMQIHLVVYLPKVEAPLNPLGQMSPAIGTLWSVEIYVDKQSIRDQIVSPVKALPPLKNIPIQSIGAKGRWDFSKLKVIGQHRIITFGETMHFNPAIQEGVQAIEQYAVKNLGTSLILTEGSLPLSLMKNRYINDGSYEIAPEYTNPLELRVLKNLRQEVKKQRRTIHYLNFDIALFSEGLGADICSFLFTLPKWRDNIALCRLVNSLKSNASLSGALQTLRNNQNELLKILREEEYYIIEHMLQQNQRLPLEGFERVRLRDRYMAENIKFLVELLSPRQSTPVLIYAHIGHLALRPTMKFIVAKPCGAYLKEWYGKELYSLALLTSGGETRVDKGFVGWGCEDVATMPDDTFEAALERRSNTPYYMKTPKIWDALHKGRLAGTYPSNSSLPFEYNLYEQAQGLLFLPGRKFSEEEKQVIRDTSQDAQAHLKMMKWHNENVAFARQRINGGG